MEMDFTLCGGFRPRLCAEEEEEEEENVSRGMEESFFNFISYNSVTYSVTCVKGEFHPKCMSYL